MFVFTLRLFPPVRSSRRTLFLKEEVFLLLTLITNIATQGLQTEPLETLGVIVHLGLGFHMMTWLTMRQPRSNIQLRPSHGGIGQP